MKIKDYPTKSLAEEYQITGMHFVFLSVKNEMCHTWIKCRDFLQDAVRNQLTGRADAIYGFKYDPKVDPKIDLKKTRMLIKGIKLDETIEYSLRLVNHYEKVAGFKPRSKITKVDDMYIFLGAGEWSQSSVLISLYTLLIRLGCQKITFKNEKELVKAFENLINRKNNVVNDIAYLKSVYKHINTVLENRSDIMFKQKDKILFGDTQIRSFHHNSGIVSLCTNKIPDEKLKTKFAKILGGIK
jgi:hypothetical protein